MMVEVGKNCKTYLSTNHKWIERCLTLLSEKRTDDWTLLKKRQKKSRTVSNALVASSQASLIFMHCLPNLLDYFSLYLAVPDCAWCNLSMHCLGLFPSLQSLLRYYHSISKATYSTLQYFSLIGTRFPHALAPKKYSDCRLNQCVFFSKWQQKFCS